jgi:RHS repeat-associated protein
VPDENPSELGAFDLTLRLPGQYYDRETNLHYNTFRDYSPEIGRYVESDPTGLLGGVNTYGYVRGNPLKFADPIGLSEIIFNVPSNQIRIIDANGSVFDCPASNNAQSLSNGPYPSGIFPFESYNPHAGGGPSSLYGSNGNFMFTVPERSYMGVHSGREGQCDLANCCNYEYATNGCIRTTDEATAKESLIKSRSFSLLLCHSMSETERGVNNDETEDAGHIGVRQIHQGHPP